VIYDLLVIIPAIKLNAKCPRAKAGSLYTHTLSLSLSLPSFIVPEFLPKLFHVSEACHSTKTLEKLVVPHLFFHKRHILHQTNFNLGFADFSENNNTESTTSLRFTHKS
jgi:hypothetical protein